MKMIWLLILAVFASKKTAENDPNLEERVGENNGGNSIVVKIEEDEYAKVNNKSKFIGVTYYKNSSKWCARRWSKKENKQISNGHYDDEETAAYASDTLARKLMQNGEQDHKLNFPDDYTEFYPEEKSSKYIGVSYHKYSSKWSVQRRSTNENKTVYNGCYDNEETAAHASDTLARKLMKNGEQNHKMNFPDDDTEIYAEKRAIYSKFFGVSYDKNSSKWCAQRWSKDENKTVFNGHYGDEETAAHASDTLARKLMENGEQNQRLNFPDDYIEFYPKEKSSKYIGVSYRKSNSKWNVRRWSKNENKNVHKGWYDNEEAAAHASDTLAKKLMKNGELKLKLNFPDDHTVVYRQENQKKRKRPKKLISEHPQNN